jgi:hydroxylaminobenzene mutase
LSEETTREKSRLKTSSEEGIMTSVVVPEASRAEHSSYLAANGATLMLAGLLCGLGVAAAPYPRLMLTAHIQFLVNGMVSVFAALLLRTSLAIVGQRSGWLIVWAHVSLWAICLSEVLAAITGAKTTLPIAAAQAGAPGAAPWQESVVTACHVVPALLLIAAWTVLVAGIYSGFVKGEPRALA